MTILENSENIPQPGEAVEEAQADSLLKRAERKRQERETNLFLDVPGWDGELICEYKVLDKKVLRDMAESQQRQLRAGEKDRMKFDLEFIARTAVGLWAVDPANGDRVKVEDDLGHVSYDRIAAKLGVEEKVKNNQEAIRYLMASKVYGNHDWEDNPIAVSQHAQAIARWMKDPSRRGISLEDILGEL